MICLDAEMQLESIRVVTESFEGSLNPFQDAKKLKGIAEERGLHMIGHFGLDETGYMSNGPHSYCATDPYAR